MCARKITYKMQKSESVPKVKENMHTYRTIAGLHEWLNRAKVLNKAPPNPTELSLTKSGAQPEVS